MTEADAFRIFGPDHLAVLVLTIVLAFAMARVPYSAGVSRMAKGLAAILLTIILLKPPLFVLVYGIPWTQGLPLDLCRISEIFCVFMLLRRSYRFFELAYFLAMAGSVSAILMPDLQYGFPDLRFPLFFLSHGLSVLAVLYGVFGYGFRPTLRSVGVVVAFLGLYTMFIAGVNVLLDANYLFLREKPQGASVIDYLGPWPWYVGALIGIAIVACFLCYLPFAFRKPSRLYD
jgi:hypothetical integral membrane protein (TIGR02206 family)